MIRITFIADTHAQHRKLNRHLPGGDIIVHAGDFTGRGYFEEQKDFYNWYDNLYDYTNKVFIAGNHELGIEDDPQRATDLINEYDNIIYLYDNAVDLFGLKIYGTPYQPQFFDWAFNLPRNGDDLKAKWDLIPEDTDILVTHGPPFGRLDDQKNGGHIGCEMLRERIDIIKPLIHVFGHCHYGHGYRKVQNTHYFNAAVLNELYMYTHLPYTVDFDVENNIIQFL